MTDPIDVAMLARLDASVAEATAAFDGFDYARALERTEAFFWWFCDDYVELVKGRAYGGRGSGPAASAHAALRHALEALQRMFAPTLPYATEESWSWSHDGSIHATSWPRATGVSSASLDLDVVSEMLGRVRRAKTEAKQSQRAAVARLVVRAPAGLRPTVEAARLDLCEALTITVIDISDGDELAIEIELAGSTES